MHSVHGGQGSRVQILSIGVVFIKYRLFSWPDEINYLWYGPFTADKHKILSSIYQAKVVNSFKQTSVLFITLPNPAKCTRFMTDLGN